jgi:serine/threonine protein kinase/formylglycine-generating enzyme required for sulfatase activity
MGEPWPIHDEADRLWSSFREIIETPVAERAERLARIHGSDPDLHRRLIKLLRFDETAGLNHFLTSPDSSVVQSSDFDLSSRITGFGAEQSASAGTPTATPRELGPYQLLEELGRGGMGTVWKARQTRLNKIVAVKVLSDQLTQDETALTRFNREMQAVGSLEHPNIVRALDADECGGTHYLVMEYVRGTDLSRTVKVRGPLSVGEACEYVRQAALGLAYAHERGLVHRDIKPSNLLLAIETDSLSPESSAAVLAAGDDGAGSTTGRQRTTVKILDLGLARLQAGDSPHEVTRFGQILGTPDYMAPEQWTDTHSVDARADLYALGCTLFYLLIGRAPYQTSENQHLGRKILAHTMDEIPDLCALRPDVPAELGAIFVRLMAKRTQDRYSSAAKLAADLAPFAIIQYGLEPEAAGKSHPSSDPSVPTAPLNATTIRQRPPKRAFHRLRRPALWGAGIAACAAAVWLATQPPDRGLDTHSEQSVASLSTPVAPPAQNASAAPDAQPRKVDGIVTDKPFDTAADAEPRLSGNSAKNMASVEKPASEPARSATSTAAPDLPKPPENPTGDLSPEKKPAVAENQPEKSPAQVAVVAEPKPGRVALPQEAPPSTVPMPKPELPPPARAERQPVRDDNWLKIRLVHCPAGTFRMGSPASDPDARPNEQPQVEVTLSEFWLGQTEITQAQWRNVMGNTDPWKDTLGKTQLYVKEGAEYPATFVSWVEANEFCRKLTDRERQDGRIPDDLMYALPTEAQWEYACRAGAETRFSFGDDVNQLVKYGWWGGKTGSGNVRDDSYAHYVAQLKPNAWGLYDMHGNVMEWCRDWYQDQLPGGADPLVTAGTQRVIRGGCWLSDPIDCRAALRNSTDPKRAANPLTGFRVALVPTGRD